MIRTPDEVIVDVLMSALSIFIEQGRVTLSYDKLELLRRCLATGRLRLVIDTPLHGIDVFTADADGLDQQHIFTVTDDRQKWFLLAA